MKSWKRILLIALVVLTILSLLLSACGPTDNSNGKPDNGKNNNKDKDKEKNKDKDKDKDNGNDVNTDKSGNVGKITICHKTGSAKNPYVMIRISNDAVKDGHAAHDGDIIPAPEGGCSATGIAPDVPAK